MVRRLCLALLLATAIALSSAAAAGAHEPGNSAVLIDVSQDAVDAHLQLPIEPLAVALDLELAAATVVERHEDLLRNYITQHISVVGSRGQQWSNDVGSLAVLTVDGSPHVTTSVRLQPSNGQRTNFTLHYDVILEELVTHDILVSLSHNGEESAVVATLGYDSNEVLIAVQPGNATNRGFLDMINFGFEHVLEGADHLLFLIVLLLPAPAVIGSNQRWVRHGEVVPSLKRVVGVASAFTVGHSITIVLVAKGGIVVPSSPVELLVALSVVASAIHAWRPIVRHGEMLIAGSFGLVHGLAFAGLLEQAGRGAASWTTLAAFNLGVELAQLITVGLTFPLIYLISRTRHYDAVRTALAGFAAVVAIGWAVERIGVARSPFAKLELASTEHPMVVLAVFAALAIGLYYESIWNRVELPNA